MDHRLHSDAAREPATDPSSRIVVLGGGTGIPTVLRGLARRVERGERIDVTAVVATADDGGSSGRIRRERGGLAPGDLRSCLLALTPESDRGRFAGLFEHRYAGSGDLAGHSVGNLILQALAEIEGSYLGAVASAGGLLGAVGRVLPVSLETIHLEAETQNGDRISGESRIGRAVAAVRRVWLDPSDAAPGPGVVETIQSADTVVLGPGSLYTSLLAVLLVPGVADAVRACRGDRVLVANLMSQPGETLGMSLRDHLEAIDEHVGSRLANVVLLNDVPVESSRLTPYREEMAEPLLDRGLEGRPERVVRAALVTPTGMIRHDPDLLAEALLALVRTGNATGSRHGHAP